MLRYENRTPTTALGIQEMNTFSIPLEAHMSLNRSPGKEDLLNYWLFLQSTALLLHAH
jgi:hypothetical protein